MGMEKGRTKPAKEKRKEVEERTGGKGKEKGKEKVKSKSPEEDREERKRKEHLTGTETEAEKEPGRGTLERNYTALARTPSELQVKGTLASQALPKSQASEEGSSVLGGWEWSLREWKGRCQLRMLLSPAPTQLPLPPLTPFRGLREPGDANKLPAGHCLASAWPGAQMTLPGSGREAFGLLLRVCWALWRAARPFLGLAERSGDGQKAQVVWLRLKDLVPRRSRLFLTLSCSLAMNSLNY